jgi:fluoride ion exporter CrcB/FEX
MLVAQLVEALRIKLEGRGFDSQWFHWNFLLTLFFRPNQGPAVDSACNRNEYQEYVLADKGGRCGGLTTLLTYCADCLEIWESQPPGTLRACIGIALPLPSYI